MKEEEEEEDEHDHNHNRHSIFVLEKTAVAVTAPLVAACLTLKRSA